SRVVLPISAQPFSEGEGQRPGVVGEGESVEGVVGHVDLLVGEAVAGAGRRMPRSAPALWFTSSMTMGAGGSSSSGTGSPGPGKVATAETDIGPYQSITVLPGPGAGKVIEGPFFVTDVYGTRSSSTDCSVMQGHTSVLAPDSV